MSWSSLNFTSLDSRVKTKKKDIQVCNIIEAVLYRLSCCGKVGQNVRSVFISGKRFSNSRFSDAPCTFRQRGIMVCVITLSLQKSVINFSFEIHSCRLPIPICRGAGYFFNISVRRIHCFFSKIYQASVNGLHEDPARQTGRTKKKV
jgi:hypothetical protein